MIILNYFDLELKKNRLVIPAVVVIIWYIFVVPGCALTGNFTRDGSASTPPGVKPGYTVYFIGDAGKTRGNEKEPALVALREELKGVSPDSSLVVFLGDNIYDNGLPDVGHPGRAAAESYLEAQLEVLTAGHSALFIPGNHDWDGLAQNGAELMLNQQKLIEKESGGKAKLLPQNGCGMPVAIDIGENLRLVLFDSQKWFREQSGITDTNRCAGHEHKELFGQVRELLASAGSRKTVLVHHHPFVTYGEHGGYFDWKKHIFPLTAFNKHLFIPLPVLGSLYPFARMNGITVQDISSSIYSRFNDSIKAVSRSFSPLFSVSGHEHSIQVIKEPAQATLQIVSGKGTRLTDGSVSTGEGTLFASPLPGYVKLEVRGGNSFSITVVIADGASATEEVFHLNLSEI